MSAHTPLVVAHRGSSVAHAEHTLAAYTRAIDEGADALECDVRMTRDGHLVCVHDRRVDRTSNGTGVVSDFELADLHGLDFASWHQGRPTDPYQPDPELGTDTADGVLTLDRLLTMVADAPRPIRIAIETKHPTRYAGLVEQHLVRTLRRFGLADPPSRTESPITVMSFAPVAIRRIRLLAPTLPTVLLMTKVSPARRDGSLPTGVRIAGPGIRLVREHPGYVARAHSRGNSVYVWTVDEPDDIDLVLSLNVDAVITNRPSDVLKRLGRC